ncbi:sensor histidine kinase [Rhodocaloribacter sp.]
MIAIEKMRRLRGLPIALFLCAGIGGLFFTERMTDIRASIALQQRAFAQLEHVESAFLHEDPALAGLRARMVSARARAELSDAYGALAAEGRRITWLVWGAYLLFAAGAFVFMVTRLRSAPDEASSTEEPEPPDPVADAATRAIAAEKLFEHGSIGVAVLDPEGRFVYANAALQRMLGYVERELQTLTLSRISAGETPGRETRLRRVRQVTDDGRKPAEAFTRRDGSTCWARLSLTAFSRDVRYCLAVFEDVTANVEAETSRREAEAAEQTKKAFLADVQREVRRPLTAILGYASALEEEAPPPQKRFVDAISANGHRLLRTVDALCELGRLEENPKPMTTETVDVRYAVTDAVAQLQAPAHEKGLRLVYQGVPEPVLVEADAVGMHRVVYHLLENAIRVAERGYVHVRVEAGTDAVRIHVRDAGGKLTVLPRPEDAHGQTRSEAPRAAGLGVGMTIARRLVERMGGTITVEREAPHGRHCTVAFPRPHTETMRRVPVMALAA